MAADPACGARIAKRRSRPSPHRSNVLKPSDYHVDRQIQLDESSLQQRHRQIVLQLHPGISVAGSLNLGVSLRHVRHEVGRVWVYVRFG
jgi:hypothetical protein